MCSIPKTWIPLESGIRSLLGRALSMTVGAEAVVHFLFRSLICPFLEEGGAHMPHKTIHRMDCFVSLLSKDNLDKRYKFPSHNISRLPRRYARCLACSSQKESSSSALELRKLLRKTPIYLVGMLGSGKSTVGQVLARRLGYSFLDTDQIIEQASKKKISEFVEENGEAELGRVESSVLNQVQSYTCCVVATGAGAVVKQSNWAVLHNGIVVFLDVAVSVLARRLQREQSNNLKSYSLEGTLEDIRKERLPFYSQADVHIVLQEDTDNEWNPESITSYITSRLVHFLREHRRV